MASEREGQNHSPLDGGEGETEGNAACFSVIGEKSAARVHTPSLPPLACRPWAVRVPTALPLPLGRDNYGSCRQCQDVQRAAAAGVPRTGAAFLDP